MRHIVILFLSSLLLVGCGRGGNAGNGSGSSSGYSGFSRITDDLTHKPGFFDLYVDEEHGTIYALLPAPAEDGLILSTIYATGLTAGLGSNPIGLDRGAFDSGAILNFRRIGGKVIAELENTGYRATADRPLEKKAVRESFAQSFIWSGSVAAKDDEGRLLVDISGLLTRDHFGAAAQIGRNANGGTYQIAADRSMPDATAALAFPENVELDAFLTLSSSKPGSEPRATAADARDVTLVQHHSFIRLPDDGYTPREADQRSGAIEVAYYDFSSPLDAPILKRYARRFRLQKEDPATAFGPAKAPIIFYVDAGAPEQIQQALIEGASWWAEAFEAAGFEDGYRVEVLPEGAHPFDVRYNMIQWTHRQTRGWSYGGGVFDPRTGEMLKANVILGSQRVRQDRMIFEGLAGADKTGTGVPDDPVQVALSRIRQLSAHEVGHTLGFAHNFAASSNDRASVMDYPAPHITLGSDGDLSFSDAYGVGVGPWDIFTAKWLYTEFPESVDAETALDAMVAAAYGEQGLRFIADSEGRSVGSANPYGSVWDNGEDAIQTLGDTMRVRARALRDFGAYALADGRALSDLNAVIVPIYLYHRYQTVAAAKSVGGLDFDYGVKGAGAQPARPVAPAEQRRALAALMTTLEPSALDLPDTVLNALTPQINGGWRGGETFSGNTGPAFDVLNAADVAATLTMEAVLHPQRAARLVAFNRRDRGALGLEETLDAMERQVFKPVLNPRYQEIANVIQTRFATVLMDLSVHADATPAVRAAAEAKLYEVSARLAGNGSDHANWLVARVSAHLTREADAGQAPAPEVTTPPGSPIGSGPAYETCWHCE